MNRQVRDEWEMRDDARTLARAEEIKADKGRYKDALSMADRIADEAIKEVSGMLKIAGRKAPKTNSENFGNPNTSRPVKTLNRYDNPATIGKF